MERTDLAAIRRDYSLTELSREKVAADPFAQFDEWMTQALESACLEATAMTLSTVDSAGRPSSRVVLLKGFDANGFVFFTNFESRKGREIAGNNNVSLNFFWPELERQVNIAGAAAKIPYEDSEAYFHSRPIESQIGAWASAQSSVLESRDQLDQRVAEITAKYADATVPLPPFWGGFCVKPVRFEFWQGRQSRLHDRIRYELAGDHWQIARLSP